MTNPKLQPATGLGAGADTHGFRGMTLAANYFGNGEGRTLSSAAGIVGQVSVNTNGTITTATGGSFLAGTLIGGIVTTAVSLNAGAPFEFLGGTVVTGISLRVVGGGTALTNWISQFQGTGKSYHQGQWIIGQTTQTDGGVFKLFVNGHQKITDNFGLFWGGTLAADAEFRINMNVSDQVVFGSAGNQTNNSYLMFDFETTANIIAVTGASSGTTPGIIWDLTSTRINGLFGFGLAPTAVQTGYTAFSNLTTRRTLDADSTTIDEIADFCGTLQADLRAKGIISV